MSGTVGGTVGLAAIAGWDVPLLRGAVGTIGLVGERLTPWRIGVDALGRQLEAADCWPGPAGRVAAAALVELSTVAASVQQALTAATGWWEQAVGDADDAVDRAAGAQVVAVTASLRLTDDGRLTRDLPSASPVMAADQLAALVEQQEAARRATALAAAALASAAAVASAVQAAGAELSALRVTGAGAPAGSTDLAGRLAPGGSAPVPHVPAAADPSDAAAWWASLTAAGQLAVLAAAPAAVGGLDGLPAWARDRANRALLAQALPGTATTPGTDADPDPATAPGTAVARATAAGLATLAAQGRPAQLVLFDPAAGLVALSVGDLDGADAVGVLVPGMNTSVVGDLGGLTGDALDVVTAAEAAAPGLAVAALVWIGYRAPGPGTVLSTAAARRSGPALDRALDGLAATRSTAATTGGPPPPRTTVLAHSYGTLVTGFAARAAGVLAADAVVLLGSPGTTLDDESDLEGAEVYEASALTDPVSATGYFGGGPHAPGFDETHLPTEFGQMHWDYYDTDRPTLPALAEVVVSGGPR